jgi:transposase
MPFGDIHLDPNLITNMLGHPATAPPLHSGHVCLRQNTHPTRACLLNVNGVVRDAGWVTRTDVVSDDLWSVIEPLMPGGRRRRRPWNDHRRTLEGIIWRYRTGSPWRDLPEEFGAWQSVAERHLRWSVDGTYAQMFTAIQARLGSEERDLLELLSVDSTSVRAHQHAAGARPARHTGGTVELQELCR